MARKEEMKVDRAERAKVAVCSRETRGMAANRKIGTRTSLMQAD